MATTRLPPDFKEFLRLLISNEVEYLVIGGYAVNYYGYARAADLAIWIAVNPTNAERIARVLREFGFRDAKPDLFLSPDKIIRMGVPPVRLEILTSISGVEFDACYGHRQRVDLDGILVDLISIDDLKANKRASGRLKDRLDLDELSS